MVFKKPFWACDFHHQAMDAGDIKAKTSRNTLLKTTMTLQKLRMWLVGHKEQGGGVHRNGDDMLFEQQHLLSTKFQVLSKKKAINFFFEE